MSIREQLRTHQTSVGRDDRRNAATRMKLPYWLLRQFWSQPRSTSSCGWTCPAHRSRWPAFMVNAIAGTIIAVLLVTWRHWIPFLLAVGFARRPSAP